MRMTQLSPNHQTPNYKPSKTTDEQLQNELSLHLAENNGRDCCINLCHLQNMINANKCSV